MGKRFGVIFSNAGIIEHECTGTKERRAGRGMPRAERESVCVCVVEIYVIFGS